MLLVPITIVSGVAIFGSVWVATSSLVVLDRRQPGVRQRLHLRRWPGRAVPDRRALHLAPAALHVPRPARVRRLRPRREDARTGPARRARRWRRGPLPRSRPRRCSSPARLDARRPSPPKHWELIRVLRSDHRRHGPDEAVRGAAQGGPSPAASRGGDGSRWHRPADRAGCDGGLHRPERGREVDDDQDAHGHPRADGRTRARRRARAEPSAHGARPAHRRGVRPAVPAVVGPPAARQLRPAAPRVLACPPIATPPTCAASPTGSSWTRCSTSPCGSSPSVSACAVS